MTSFADLPSARVYAWGTGGRLIAGWGDASIVDPGVGQHRFRRAAERVAPMLAEQRGRGDIAIAFASFTFDAGEPGSSVAVPSTTLWSDPAGVRVTGPDSDMARAPVPNGAPDIRYAGSSITELQWLEAVDRATKEIAAGNVGKVVLARDVFVWSKDALDARVLADRLARRFPECYTFIHGDLLGATPELLVRRFGEDVESLVLAGTARRGTTPEEDARIGRDFLASAKDVEEHRYAVDSVTSVFAEICESSWSEPRPMLLKLANVQHLATPVHGRLGADLSALEIAGLLHPTAAVCGAPTEDALNLIASLEGMSRGRYAGPIGWVDADGNGEFGIALRCAEVRGDRARLFAGNGIVRGSRPEAELEETRLKLRAMQSALEAH
jgi:menaquinone-specific isochorismate synthase